MSPDVQPAKLVRSLHAEVDLPSEQRLRHGAAAGIGHMEEFEAARRSSIRNSECDNPRAPLRSAL